LSYAESQLGVRTKTIVDQFNGLSNKKCMIFKMKQRQFTYGKVLDEYTWFRCRFHSMVFHQTLVLDCRNAGTSEMFHRSHK